MKRCNILEIRCECDSKHLLEPFHRKGDVSQKPDRLERMPGQLKKNFQISHLVRFIQRTIEIRNIVMGIITDNP